jgi:hypothetical protein
VTELTGLLREGPGGDQLAGWPPSMRVFARRERPRPGAQLTLFEAHDGWRYSLWVTNLPASLRGWRANPAYIDAAHRVHARVEDGIRTGKDCGIGTFPRKISRSIPPGWPLLALDGDLARAEPKTLRYKILHHRRPAGPWRATASAENLQNLAVGHRDSHRLGPPQRPAAGSVTSAKTSPRSRKEHHSGARGTPRPPGPPAGSLSYPDPKIKILNEAQRPFQTSHRST